MTFRQQILALAIAATVSAVPLVAAGPASAGQASARSTSASSQKWRYVGYYTSYPKCVAAGKAGVERGDWLEYQCRPFILGPSFFNLYVSP